MSSSLKGPPDFFIHGNYEYPPMWMLDDFIKEETEAISYLTNWVGFSKEEAKAYLLLLEQEERTRGKNVKN